VRRGGERPERLRDPATPPSQIGRFETQGEGLERPSFVYARN